MATALHTTLESELQSAVTDIQSGNWEAALDHVIAAEAALAGIPASKQADAEFDFDAKSTQIASLKKSIQQRRAGANASANGQAGLQWLKFKPAATTS